MLTESFRAGMNKVIFGRAVHDRSNNYDEETNLAEWQASLAFSDIHGKYDFHHLGRIRPEEESKKWPLCASDDPQLRQECVDLAFSDPTYRQLAMGNITVRFNDPDHFLNHPGPAYATMPARMALSEVRTGGFSAHWESRWFLMHEGDKPEWFDLFEKCDSEAILLVPGGLFVKTHEPLAAQYAYDHGKFVDYYLAKGFTVLDLPLEGGGCATAVVPGEMLPALTQFLADHPEVTHHRAAGEGSWGHVYGLGMIVIGSVILLACLRREENDASAEAPESSRPKRPKKSKDPTKSKATVFAAGVNGSHESGHGQVTNCSQPGIGRRKMTNAARARAKAAEDAQSEVTSREAEELDSGGAEPDESLHGAASAAKSPGRIELPKDFDKLLRLFRRLRIAQIAGDNGGSHTTWRHPDVPDEIVGISRSSYNDGAKSTLVDVRSFLAALRDQGIADV